MALCPSRGAANALLIKSFKINNIRNISGTHIEPIPGLNCFIGPNGAGKTSILEALVVLSKGRSFRSGQIASLIGSNSNNFQIIAEIECRNGNLHRLGLERDATKWTARHNGENIVQISELTRLLPHVLIEPSSHLLVSGPPEGRRKYLDWCVFHVKRGYLLLWRRYNRVLKQRNAALRQSNAMMVESLDPQLIELGEQLHLARSEHASALSATLQKTLPKFNKMLNEIKLSYRKGWTGESLASAVQDSLIRDTERGATGPGPHRADLYLTLARAPAKERLSRGEQKTLTAAMVLAQAELICESGEPPILLLDDPSSELDDDHLGKLLAAALELGLQTWLTNTDMSPVVASCGADYALFHVKHGSVIKTVTNNA